MLSYFLPIIIIFNFIFSYENYKQIKINNPTREIMIQLAGLGAELDHCNYSENEYIEFAASNTLIDRINDLDITFDQETKKKWNKAIKNSFIKI